MKSRYYLKMKIEEAKENLILALKEEADAKRLKELNQEIKNNYSQLISDFKTAEAKFNEAKKYGKYHPDYEFYHQKYLLAKDQLFKQPLVSEYKILERNFSRDLEEIGKAIKKEIIWLNAKDYLSILKTRKH